MDKFTDIELVFPTKTFRSHRIKLYEDSAYFRNLFDDIGTQKNKDILDFGTIQNIDAESIENYFRVLYNIDKKDIDYIALLKANKYLESKAINRKLSVVNIKRIDQNNQAKIFNYICNYCIYENYDLYMALIGLVDMIKCFDLLSSKSICALMTQNLRNVNQNKIFNTCNSICGILLSKQYSNDIINIVIYKITVYLDKHNVSKLPIEIKKYIVRNFDIKYIIDQAYYRPDLIIEAKNIIEHFREDIAAATEKGKIKDTKNKDAEQEEDETA